MGEKFITANEARTMSEMSEALKNHVYKNINYEAKDNKCKLYWNVEDCNPTAVKDLIDDLKEKGYIIEYKEEEFTLIIKW